MRLFILFILLLLLTPAASARAQFVEEDPPPPLRVESRPLSLMLGEQAFDRHAFNTARMFDEVNNTQRGASLDLTAGRFRHQGERGWDVRLTPDLEWGLAEPFALSLALPVQYRRIPGVDVVDAGVELAVPIRGWLDSRERFAWQVAPLVQVGQSWPDQGRRGYVYGGGVGGSIGYRSRHTSVILGQQLTQHEGRSMEVAGYHIDTEIIQRISRTGMKLSHRVGDTTFEAGLIHTRLREPAPVRRFTTPALGVRMQVRETVDLRLGYNADIARGFRRHAGQATMSIRW
jgi:hypothetical protein